jgi:hypothetical protein
MTVHCYTSFTFSYLSRARILAQTLRAANPNWVIWALITDEPPPDFDYSPCLHEFDHFINTKDLQFERFYAWLFKHDIVEACTAVKGQMLVYLLELGAEKVVYLDPDIAVFHPLDEIEQQLDSASIILTPHQHEPNNESTAIQDNEITSMQYGVFNLGFVAVRNDRNGLAFAKWWAKQLYRACYDDVINGIFTDQKYCDLVPGLFNDVYVSRDPGCNVASWNLSRRMVRIHRDGTVAVNSSPLKFYHFTKIGAAGDIMTDRYARDNIEVYELWNWYKRRLKANELPGIPKRWWYYNNFNSGKAISRKIRLFYRSREDLMNFFDNPFLVEGNSLYNWIACEQPQLLQG